MANPSRAGRRGALSLLANPSGAEKSNAIFVGKSHWSWEKGDAIFGKLLRRKDRVDVEAVDPLGNRNRLGGGVGAGSDPLGNRNRLGGGIGLPTVLDPGGDAIVGTPGSS